MPPDLVAGRVAVVTGGARGIGLAVVAAVAARGVHVLCLDHPSADRSAFDAVCADAGVSGELVGVDVRDQAAVRTAVSSAGDLGRVSYAVNCAGVDALEPSAGVDAASWSRVLDVDLDGVMFACQAEHAVMAGGGSIVNIASMSGHVVNRGVTHAAYSAAKAGVIQLSKALAVEWAPEGLRVNSVSPGYTMTAMTRDNPPEVNAAFADQTPMARLAEVEEIAEPVVFLLGGRASFVTGTDLLVDGGFTAW
ncbi:SDR family oxidoreductase [Phycicoccus flavus]|uniref:SDR family oxidoreductase n=1 Tax=Phycicoccus flavus TaxID=2502783 RepID=A0A8T6R5U9_9MICO|nr:SDR family oxidoreductase [Phycicoccus flavus]NHA69818.1 SDR family oxidoreductase [Phycicoccus flavus]